MRPSVPHRLSVMANAGQSLGDDEESEEEEDGGRMGRQQQTRRTETREELVDAQAESTNQHGEARMMDARAVAAPLIGRPAGRCERRVRDGRVACGPTKDAQLVRRLRAGPVFDWMARGMSEKAGY